MKQAERGRGAGYTVLETLIFLAVTGAMFASAMAFISGRQARTEFAAAVRDFEASMNDIANDVATGYYVNALEDGRQIDCTVVGGDIVLGGTAGDEQGTNKGCIFIGRALLFNSTSYQKEQYATMTMVGKQFKNGVVGSGDSENYAESGVKVIADSGPTDSTPNAIATARIGGGATIGCVLMRDSPAPATYSCDSPGGMRSVDTVAFMTKFRASSLEEENRTGSAAVNLVAPLSTVAVGSRRSAEVVANEINQYNDATPGATIVTNPAGGVHICLQSNGSNQHAWVILGGKNSRFSASSEIVGEKC
ncbi:MAG TPA: hypothetical protein VGE30_02075 [Candidatus Saccharimonadales bacterium]